jgi:hypothetical protein
MKRAARASRNSRFTKGWMSTRRIGSAPIRIWSSPPPDELTEMIKKVKQYWLELNRYAPKRAEIAA